MKLTADQMLSLYDYFKRLMIPLERKERSISYPRFSHCQHQPFSAGCAATRILRYGRNCLATKRVADFSAGKEMVAMRCQATQ